MLDLLNFQEKLENHVSVLNSPRISVPLQYLYIGVGLVNGTIFMVGDLALSVQNLKACIRFQKYIAQMHLYTPVIARVYGNSPPHR